MRGDDFLQNGSLKPGLRTVHDVVIVGAGPGGSALAIHLARAGLDVVLAERGEFPRHKVCGDFVSPKGLAHLRELGCLQEIERWASPPILHAVIVIGGRRVAGGDIPQVHDWPAHGYAVPRIRLDALLAEHATRAGTTLLESFHVHDVEFPRSVSPQRPPGFASRVSCEEVVRINGRQGGHPRTLRARLVVGADGARSTIANLARSTADTRRLGMAAVRAYAEGLPLDGSLQLFDEDFFPGYGWAFPTGPDSANVGVGVLTDGLTGARVNLRRWFDRVVAQLRDYARRRGARLQVSEPVGWPIRCYTPGASYSFERGLLVGEAAGLVDPISGEGIPLAFESAALAARTIRQAFAQGRFSAATLISYDDACIERFDTDLRISELLVSTIANRHLAAAWIRALEMFARIADGDLDYARTAGGVLAGVRPARELVAFPMLAKTALRAPLQVATMLANDPPRSLSDALDRTIGWTRQATSIMEGLLGDRDRVSTWACEIATKQSELARRFLRRSS